jgi:hypothetical protein
VSIVHGRASFGDFDFARGPMQIEGDEEIDGAVAAVLARGPPNQPATGSSLMWLYFRMIQARIV